MFPPLRLHLLHLFEKRYPSFCNADFDFLKRQVLKQHLRPCFFIGKANARPLALPGLTVVC